MVPFRFFLPAAAFVATTVQGQEPRAVATAEPALGGVVRDVAGLPVPEVEVGIIRGERLQQFVITPSVVRQRTASLMDGTSLPAADFSLLTFFNSFLVIHAFPLS